MFIFMVAGLASCSATNSINRNHPYQNAYDTTTKRIEVSRDHKVQPNCPIIFSINDTNVGRFAANDHATYYLKPDHYTLTASNCTGTATFDVNIQADKNRVFLLSLDGHGHPMIVNKK
ncbi:hypothetical protein J7560_05025 [Wohlfahrtiimonas chitiniclastica]|nr:hypothetical protein [Wohlfahrtiimonas chitiniclastica]